MPHRAVSDKYLVAFSLAGEQRTLVRAVAEEVEERLGAGQVFFDEWYEHYIAGDDADLKLQQLYGDQCELSVVCLSRQYGDKPWTRAENAAIRARHMRLQQSGARVDELRMLPLRVGDGDVEGLLFNTIAPDVRERTPASISELIVERLFLIRPDLRPSPAGTPGAFWWPETSQPLAIWPMANHTDARAAFEQLLTRQPPWRYLPLRGASDTGKSEITRQMLANAIRIPKLACGRLDFKGTTGVDNEVRALVELLEVPIPAPSPRLNERLSQVLEALKHRARPTVLIFDTYEAAGEAQDWVEKQLLLRVMRDDWLRVVIVGQSVPRAAGAVWESIARAPLQLVSPPAEEWFAFGQRHKANITLDFVRQAYDCCSGNASVLAQLLGPGR